MLARYDLGWKYHPPTFDFFSWMMIVKAKGATKLVLDNLSTPRIAKYPIPEIRSRIDTIIKAGLVFTDLPWREGHDGEYISKGLVPEFIPYMKDFVPIKTVLPPGKEKYTVTIRNTKKNSFRNSDEVLWRAFAKEIGAYVIEDYSVKPIKLVDRMALYAGAKMNFGVINGPLAMLYFTHYPYLICDCAINRKGWGQHNMRNGDQIPWARPNQILSWEKPTLNSLMKLFKQHAQ